MEKKHLVAPTSAIC